MCLLKATCIEIKKLSSPLGIFFIKHYYEMKMIVIAI